MLDHLDAAVIGELSNRIPDADQLPTGTISAGDKQTATSTISTTQPSGTWSFEAT
jgi:hypothetical protein